MPSQLDFIVTLQALAYTLYGWIAFKYMESKEFDFGEFDLEVKKKAGEDPSRFFTVMHLVLKIIKSLNVYGKVALLIAVLLEAVKMILRNNFQKEIPYSFTETSTSLLTGVMFIHFMVFYLLGKTDPNSPDSSAEAESSND